MVFDQNKQLVIHPIGPPAPSVCPYGPTLPPPLFIALMPFRAIVIAGVCTVFATGDTMPAQLSPLFPCVWQKAAGPQTATCTLVTNYLGLGPAWVIQYDSIDSTSPVFYSKRTGVTPEGTYTSDTTGCVTPFSINVSF